MAEWFDFWGAVILGNEFWWSGQMAGFRLDWSPESGWPDSGEGGRIPPPDSGDINRMLSDSDTGNISMVVGCLNMKVDCSV
jgi:hypothetical protein